MNSNKIEKISLRTIENLIESNEYLAAYLDENDKTPSWDGSIFIYTDVSLSKDFLFGKLSVQVKGKLMKSNFPDSIKYNVEVSDLKNYLNDGGVFYFVVGIIAKENEHITKIYYKMLLPIDLNNILDEQTKKQKTKTITFEQFSMNKKDIKNIFTYFINEKKRQFSTYNHSLFELIKNNPDIKNDIKEYSFSIPNVNNSFINYLLQNPIYVYGIYKNIGIKVPIGKFFPTEIHMKSNYNISLDNFSCNYNCIFIESKNNHIIKIEDTIYICFQDERYTWKYEPNKNIIQNIKGIDFIIKFLRSTNMYVDNCLIFQEKSIENVPESLLSWYNDLLSLQELLQNLNISEEKVNIQDIDTQSLKNIFILNKALIKKEIIIIKENIPPICKFKVANLNILVLSHKISECKYRFADFFQLEENENFVIKFNNEETKINKFFLLEQLDFEEISNINYDNILLSIKNIECNSIYIEEVNALCLNMLLAYDNRKINQILDICIELFKCLLEKSKDKYIKINYLQCIKRKRSFNEKEKKLLNSISCNDKDILIRLSLLLLNENIEQAKIIYAKLNNNKKEIFSSFPIYNLMKKS